MNRVDSFGKSPVTKGIVVRKCNDVFHGLGHIRDSTFVLNPIPPGLFEGGSAWRGGGGRKVPAAYNSKTINDNEMKFGGTVKDH